MRGASCPKPRAEWRGSRDSGWSREGGKGRRDGRGGIEAVKRFVARYVPTLWLLAVLSLVGWFIWNGDLAGWILLALVIGLMAWQLTGREKRPRRARTENANGHGVHDESSS